MLQSVKVERDCEFFLLMSDDRLYGHLLSCWRFVHGCASCLKNTTRTRHQAVKWRTIGWGRKFTNLLNTKATSLLCIAILFILCSSLWPL